jgi:hypothetical protein
MADTLEAREQAGQFFLAGVIFSVAGLNRIRY